MIKYPKLYDKIQERGLKLKFVASKIGLSYNQFYLRMSGKLEFQLSEMQTLSKLLDESMDYLFN